MAATGHLDHLGQPPGTRAAGEHFGGDIREHQVRLRPAQAQHWNAERVVVVPDQVVIGMVCELTMPMTT